MNKPTFNELLQLWGRFYANSKAVETPLLGCRPQWAMVSETSGRTANLAPEIDAQLIAIDRAINKLPKLDKSAILLRYKYGYSFNRIAKHYSANVPKYRDARKIMCNKTAERLVEMAIKTLEGYYEGARA